MNLPKFKFKWNFLKNEKNFQKPTITTTSVLINGKLATCLILSLVSAFIDIVFFSGLSISGYPFFKWVMPAAVLLSIMSVGFSCGKFFVAMQLAAMKEIKTRLREMGYKVTKGFKFAEVKWQVVHKFLITISIITSISLSVITIGNGVRRMEQNIKNMSSDATYLIELNNSLKEGTTDKRNAAKGNIQGVQQAQETARAEVDRYFSILEKYQAEYLALNDEDKEGEKGQKIIAKIVKEIPGTTKNNAIYFNRADLQKSIQKTASSNETINSVEIYQEAIAYDEKEIENFIISLQDKNYRMPNGEAIIFIEDGKAINRQSAISRLQNGIMEWQCDTGDAGVSSKVFTIVATYLKADESAGGLGASEIMMMILIMVFGIVQEFLIALFTPKATINRKMISQFSEYLEGVDINMFMLKTYKSYLDRGILSSESFEAKAKKAVNLMENSMDDIIAKYSKKNKPKKVVQENKEKEFSSKVDESVKEIEELLK